MLVRYPSDKTYRVRRSNLMPVLEHERDVVLVAAETEDYRRIAIVHTREDDHFMEIGCDFGVLVDSVDCRSRVGIDKSEVSINAARRKYPTREFILGDVFQGVHVTPRHPLVLAIDINGNRLLPAVIKCIQLAMDLYSPRIIIVKSKKLHAQIWQHDHDHDHHTPQTTQSTQI